MKSIRNLSGIGFSIIFLVSSCTMEKRVYMSGYHIEWLNNKQKTVIKSLPATNTIDNTITADNTKEVTENNLANQDTNSECNGFSAEVGNEITGVFPKSVFKKQSKTIDAINREIENSKIKSVKANRHLKKIHQLFGSNNFLILLLLILLAIVLIYLIMLLFILEFFSELN